MLLYRYVEAAEFAAIGKDRAIRSLAPTTYFTPDRYDDPVQARRRLALPGVRPFRVGPIMEEQAGASGWAIPSVVQPLYGQPGGGRECQTPATTYLFGGYDMVRGAYAF